MIQLVLLPGMDGTGELFKSFIEEFSQNYKVTVVTYPRDRILSNAQYLECVNQACAGIDSFVLIAESFSTPISIEFAANNPENLKALILCAGFVSNLVTGWRRFVLKCTLPLLFRFPISDFAMQIWLAGKDASPEILQSVRKAISSVHPKVMKDRLMQILSCDQRTNLSKINIPILYLEATEDRLIPNTASAEIKRIQQSTILAQLDGPHLLLQREPQKTSEIILNFISTQFLCVF